MHENEISGRIIGYAIEVHRELGPGLLESVYEEALCHELNLDGQPYSRSHPELLTRVRRWDDGFCIRHWVDGNSIKLYNLFNNLRAETTMNQPGKFSVYRTKQGQDAEAPKARLPPRKGIADATLLLRPMVFDHGVPGI